MRNTFMKEQIIMNYCIIAIMTGIVVVSNLVYGGAIGSWTKSIALLIVVTAALLIKNKKIKKSGMELDERLRFITHHAISIGFYFMLGALFWFLIKDMITTGQVPTSTIIILLAGLVGYLGDFCILYKRY